MSSNPSASYKVGEDLFTFSCYKIALMFEMTDIKRKRAGDGTFNKSQGEQQKSPKVISVFRC